MSQTIEPTVTEQKSDSESPVARLNRVSDQNASLLDSKKLLGQDGRIYIITSQQYAPQSIFKVGRTQPMSSRTKTSNDGDTRIVLNEYKVHDSVVVERYIHSKLQHVLVDGEVCFFRAPYKEIVAVVEMCVKSDAEINALANALIDRRYALEADGTDHSAWTDGVPDSAFAPNYVRAPTDCKISLKKLTPEVKLELARNVISMCVKEATGQEYNLPEDSAKPLEPKVKLKWKTVFEHIRNRMQRGDGGKMSKQQAEWSMVIAEAVSGAVGIDFISYHPHKNNGKLAEGK